MIISHNTDTGLAFYNDRVKEIIAADLIAEPFTYVPIKAGHMELVGGNAIVFGKITEGEDISAIDIVVDINYQDVSLHNPRINLTVKPVLLDVTFITYGEGTPQESTIRQVTAVLSLQLPSQIYVDSYYNVSLFGLIASYKAKVTDTIADVKAGIEAAIPAMGVDVLANPDPSVVQFFSTVRLYNESPVYENGDENTPYGYTYNAYISTLGYTIKYPQLKRGAVQSFGVVYKDRAGRTCSVIKTTNLAIYIPFYSEVVGIGNILGSIVNITFEIRNHPPDWAESYEIVYFGNISMDYFVQMRADNITSIGNHRYSLNIQETFDYTRDKNNRWKVSSYMWAEGDRLRILGTTYAGGAIGANHLYDYEIEETGTQYGDAIGGDWLIFQAVDHPTPFEGETNILVEVYRPRKGLGQTVAYGTGMVFDIEMDALGNKYHKGDVDQVFDSRGVCTTPASVLNTAQDCWKHLRLNYGHAISDIEPFWAENIFPSDWWGGQILSNKLTSAGFPFLDDLSQRQTVLNQRIRHGGFIITGTRTNNIAHFTYDDFRDLPEKDGEINGLREIGFTLKVIQRYKETSIYVNRVQTFNPDGTEQFTLTDTFLGTMRPMDDDYGCQHPDGITVNGRNLYYWDNSQGVFIRSAPNGQQAISGPEYKMSRYFKDIVRWIQTSGGGQALQVRIGANNEHKEIWITFRMNGEVRGVIFSEKRDRYISHIDQITESYIHLGNFFAHLYEQRVWIMNIDEGQDFLSWSGGLTYGEVEVVSNAEPLKNKVFNAVAVFADHLLMCLEKFVHIPREATAANRKMESNIPVWENQEGIYFGEIMKDVNSKGNFINLYDRKLNGDEMRGRYCFVKLRSTEHSEKVRIDSIVVFSTPSERNI